jgi:hypothetical protein
VGGYLLNWSKGLTVKERILLHLSSYLSYSDSEEVPEALTQQGIANIISAPRPHVSMALKDFRSNNQVTEQMCRVIHGKRKQKVYFLTSVGVQITNSLKQQLMETKIKLISDKPKADDELITIAQALPKLHLSLLDLVSRISPEGTLDLNQLSKPAVATPVTKPSKHIETPPQPESPPPTKPVQETGQEPKVQTGPGFTPQPTTQYPAPYMEPYADLGKYKARTPYEPTMSADSEKFNVGLFFTGLILLILMGVSGIYLITTGELLVLIPFIVLMFISITCLTLSIFKLWMFFEWHSRIINLLVITLSFIIYILIYSAIKPDISYYDLGLWLIIIISLLGLTRFGTFIPQNHRAQVLAGMGIIIIINSLISVFLGLLDGYDAGFWVLSGGLCAYLSYTLFISRTTNVFAGIGLGLSLGIIIASALFLSFFQFDNNLTRSVIIIIGIVLWIVISVFILIQTIRSFKGGSDVENTLRVLYSSLPIMIGIALFFFGIFLIRFEKFMEIVIELFLGIIVIIYGFQRLKGYEWSQLIISGIVIIAIIYSLIGILIS